MLNQGSIAVRDQESEHEGFVCWKIMMDIFTSYLHLAYILNYECFQDGDRPRKSSPGIRTGIQVSH